MDEGYARKLRIALNIPAEAAAALVAAGHDTPRKVAALGDEELRALAGEVVVGIVRTKREAKSAGA